MILFLTLAFALVATPVESSPLKNEWTSDFYSKVLDCQPLTLDCLGSKGLIERLGANFYSFRDDGGLRGFSANISQHERFTSERLLAWLPGPILLLPHLPGMQPVPVIDAIAFSSNGHPLANISLKSTFLTETSNSTVTVKYMMKRARAAHIKMYNTKYFSTLFGFSVDRDGALVANPRSPFQKQRQLIIKGFFHLLGFEISPESSRQAWLAIDLTNQVRGRSFRIFEGLLVDAQTSRYEGQFLRVEDPRQPFDEITHPKGYQRH